MATTRHNYNPAAEGEAAAKAEIREQNRGELISKPYRVLLWNGRTVQAWASGVQNNFATLSANFNGNWATLGDWPWPTLERAYRENTPLRQ